MLTRTSITALLAAAMLVPAGVATAGPGKSDGKGKPAKTEKQSKAKKKGHAKAKNAVFSGVVEAVDVAANTVTVKVDKANSWGRRFKGESVVFDLSQVKKLGVNDGADEGTDATLADVAVGDKAHAQAKILKTAVSPLVARKFKVQYPEPETAPAP